MNKNADLFFFNGQMGFMLGPFLFGTINYFFEQEIFGGKYC